ncbi:hypothetical protein F0U60_24785 [Archangium minus]|uniref:Outer membrane protein beta-barrel domain-containing protein n=1 Tax=Archangium minus TaxID=83450 RepID=A0ABY9WTK0_9BACT|nr:hypothetical protein F0U60_24785 [Archangium minus]
MSSNASQWRVGKGVRPVPLCFLISMLALSGAQAQASEAEVPHQSTDEGASAGMSPKLTPLGLYPLWENTGHVLGHGRLYVGTQSVEIGLLDRVQLGGRPFSFVFRTPNVHAKVSLLRNERLSIAAHAEALVFLPGSSEAFTSSNYVSRLDTRDVTLTVLPVGATASFTPVPWFQLHGTATVMGTFGNEVYVGRATVGASLVAQLLVREHHAFSTHVGEMGFWNHDFTLIGASYRFRIRWFEAQLGYFYRFMPDGGQSSPLLSLGAYL